MRLIIFFAATFSVLAGYSQESPYSKFGKIAVADLQKKVYSIDSGAKAVVLSDIGDISIQGNSKGWFSVLRSQHRVVHILNKNGYDYADVTIPLYNSGNGGAEEKLEYLKAVSYNLENGKIVETKLDKGAVFTEKASKNLSYRKFTIPAVKEGTIIEYEYRVLSDYMQSIDPWKFQGGAPRLWSECKFSVPQFFSYVFLTRGYHPYDINVHKDRTENFRVMDSRSTGPTEQASFSSGVTDYRWVMKDVPELKAESFTSTLENHISQIEFQLSSQNHPLDYHDYRNTWPALTKELLLSENFGSALDNNNGWIDTDIKPVIAGSKTELEKAQKIYSFVRDNFTCTSDHAVYAQQPIKTVFKSRKGTVSEINLLLVALLKHAGLNSDPVILSTSENGYVFEYYPLVSRFNYVLTKCKIDDHDYFMDASKPRLGFGKLMYDCYNGHARVVNEDATALNFNPDSLTEKKITMMFVANDANGKWISTINQVPGYYESYQVRNKLKEKGADEFFKEIQKAYGAESKLTAPVVDSLDQYENPVALHYAVDMTPSGEDILYVNPMFGEATKKNPFTSAERYYPVEMPYTFDETYLLTMEVPKGYEVDELPKQVLAKYDEEGKSFFEYRITQSGGMISFRSRIKMNKTLYAPDEYEILREFFNMVVKKQNEQIVFKKKK